MTASLFVSYARRDSAAVTSLVDRLTAAGYSVWLDRSGIEAASRWSERIVDALHACQVVLAFVSGESVASHNVVKELSIASEERKPILPIHLEPVVIPKSLRYQFAGIQHITWHQGEPENNFRELVRALDHCGVAATPLPEGKAEPAGQLALRLSAPPWVFRRPGLLQEALARLRDQGPRLVLQGLAGVGKTTLLCELADEESGPATTVVVRCDGPAALEPAYLLEEINAAAGELGRGLDPEVIRRNSPENSLIKLADRLKDHPLLLLLDGVEPAQGEWLKRVFRAFPSRHTRAVATARERLGGPEAAVMVVPPLTDTEAVAFVAERVGPLGLDVSPQYLIDRLPPGLRSHPFALSTLLAQLADIPLDLLLEAGFPEEVFAPLQLVGQVITTFDQPTRLFLGLVSLLSGLDFTTALKAAGVTPNQTTVKSLQTLLARSLVHRNQNTYTVPAIVGEALMRTAPDVWLVALEQVAAALRPSSAEGDLQVTLRARVVHHLAGVRHWERVRDLTPEALLESLNVRGRWKDYSLLLRHALAAAQATGDTPLRVRLGCRLTRKLIQMGDPNGARAALREVEKEGGTLGATLEQAELHSHRGITLELDRDEAGALRELQESKRLRAILGDRPGLAAVENLIGNLTMRRGDPAGARQCFEAALALLSEDELKQRTEVETSLGLCDLIDGNVEGAERRLQAVVDVCRRGDISATLPRALLHLAMAQVRCERQAEALGHAREAAQRAKDMFPAVFQAAELLRQRLETGPAESVRPSGSLAIRPEEWQRLRQEYHDALVTETLAQSGLATGSPTALRALKEQLRDFCLATGRDLRALEEIESEANAFVMNIQT
jgi:hypothetical protein